MISVSSPARIFTLMRVMPPVRTKSAKMPASRSISHSSSPVRPATKPVAAEEMPKLFSTAETLMPLPPARRRERAARLISPLFSSGRETM